MLRLSDKLPSMMPSATRPVILAAAVAVVVAQCWLWLFDSPHWETALAGLVLAIGTGTVLAALRTGGVLLLAALAIPVVAGYRWEPLAYPVILLVVAAQVTAFQFTWCKALKLNLWCGIGGFLFVITAAGPYPAFGWVGAWAFGIGAAHAVLRILETERAAKEVRSVTRKRLARSVHDEVARGLSRTVLELRALRTDLVEGDVEKETAVKNLELLDQDIVEIMAKTRGLIEALDSQDEELSPPEWFRGRLNKWGRAKNLRLDLRWELTCRHRVAESVAAELLANAEKYAYPSTAVKLVAKLVDDGRWIELTQSNLSDPEPAAEGIGGGKGLEFVRRLVDQAGGEFAVAQREHDTVWMVMVRVPA